MDSNNFKAQLNDWGHNKVPFLFFIDFEMQRPKAWQINEINSDELLWTKCWNCIFKEVSMMKL